MDIWKHGDMKTWRQGKMETWRHENMECVNMETWKHGDVERGHKHEDMYMKMETWRWTHVQYMEHGHGDIDIETWRHGHGDMVAWKRSSMYWDIQHAQYILSVHVHAACSSTCYICVRDHAA